MNETKPGAPKTAATLSITAVVVLLAANGTALFTSLQAGWDFVLRIVQQMPLGLGTFLLGLSLGCAMMAFLRRFIPETPDELKDRMHLRMFLIELVSMGAAFAVIYVQQATLMGVILGAFAGLLVSVTYRLAVALGAVIMRRLA